MQLIKQDINIEETINQEGTVIEKELLEKTHFKDIEFYHYYDDLKKSVTKPIDYTIGHVMRTPDHDERVKNPYRAMSIVVDCIK